MSSQYNISIIAVNYMITYILDIFRPYTMLSKANFIVRNMTHADSIKPERRNDTRWKSCLKKLKLKSAIAHEYVKKYASHLNVQTVSIPQLKNIVIENTYNSYRKLCHILITRTIKKSFSDERNRLGR